VAAATVGGIEANRTRPAEFLYDNLLIAGNIIRASAELGVTKLMFLGTSCFYPRDSVQPIPESALLTGPLESTNESYAIAKIAGVKLCQAYRRQYGKDFISVVPTNLYGPGDSFDANQGHVIAALIVRIHDACLRNKRVVDIWGSGRPEREFLHVDDAADAMVFLFEHYSGEDLINIAGGEVVSVAVLAGLIAAVAGYDGEFRFDMSRPDGMPRKALDPSRLFSAGWRPRITLRDGLAETYEWFLSAAPAAQR